MGYLVPIVPVELFPGDWCLNCVDPHHPDADCHMLEMSEDEHGRIVVEACGCNSSVTPGAPGRYVIRVTRLQTE